MKILNLFIDGEYCIAYRKRKNEELLMTKTKRNKFDVLKANWRFWYADPFVYNIKGTDLVFMEVFDRIHEKGFIGVSEFNKKGRLCRPCKIIEENFHMSFPLIFEVNGDYYMLPETGEAHQLRIYKMGENFTEWELVKKFELEDELVDTIILKDKGRFYFLGSVPAQNPHYTKMKLFYLNSFEDQQLIECNEVIEGKEYDLSVRNGGNIITYNDNIYRIRQRSKDNEYGISFMFAKIINFSEDTFEEEIVKEVTVQNIEIPILPLVCKKKGTHTYSRNEKYEIVDVSLGKINFGNMIRKVCKWILKK